MKWRILTEGQGRVKRAMARDWMFEGRSSYLPDGTTVKRIVPIKLVSLICSPV